MVKVLLTAAQKLGQLGRLGAHLLGGRLGLLGCLVGSLGLDRLMCGVDPGFACHTAGWRGGLLAMAGLGSSHVDSLGENGLWRRRK